MRSHSGFKYCFLEYLAVYMPILCCSKRKAASLVVKKRVSAGISYLTHSNSAYRARFSLSPAVSPATYVNTWSGYVEGAMYILAAIVLVTAAYYAVVELRWACAGRFVGWWRPTKEGGLLLHM